LAVLKDLHTRALASDPGVDDIENVVEGHRFAKTDCGKQLSRAQTKNDGQSSRAGFQASSIA
jgi:hypothetical protein